MQPLSKAKLKVFASLHDKKARRRNSLFLAEGHKLLAEALASAFLVEAVVAQVGLPAEALRIVPPQVPVYLATRREFEEMTGLVNPEGILAVVHLPAGLRTEAPPPLQLPAFALHDVQDPGNLGTLLRTADWFGLRAVYCSVGTVDAFGPKVVRAAMGAVFRVPVYYLEDFEGFVRENARQAVATVLGGKPLPQASLDGRGLVVLGSESHGLPDSLAQAPGILSVEIPGGGGAESLNVAVAAGILAYTVRQA